MKFSKRVTDQIFDHWFRETHGASPDLGLRTYGQQRFQQAPTAMSASSPITLPNGYFLPTKQYNYAFTIGGQTFTVGAAPSFWRTWRRNNAGVPVSEL